MATSLVRLLLRRGSASQFSSLNPVLLGGEATIETDTTRIRVGDGATPYNSLRVFLSSPATAISAAQAFLNSTSALAQRTALGFTATIADLNDVALISAPGWTLISAPTLADQRAILGVDVVTDSVGQISHFYATSAPAGWLKANGAAVSRTAYASLYAKLGTFFGAGDGSTTFNLPDLRGEFLRAWDDSRGIDASRAIGTSQLDAGQDHYHGINAGAGGGAVIPGTQTAHLGGLGPLGTKARQFKFGSVELVALASETAGVRTAAETRPRNIAMLACIRYL